MQEDTISAKDWNTRPIEDELRARIAELEESDKHWAGNVKVCMQLIERYESDIAELEEIDRMRSESVSTLNQANANNEDEIELLEKRIAKLKAKNETLKTACDILRKQNQRLFSQVFSDGKPELNVCKACGGDGTVLLTDGYEGQVIATAKCIYCNGTGRVSKEREE
jgi:chromosome segregation ATPase